MYLMNSYRRDETREGENFSPMGKKSQSPTPIEDVVIPPRATKREPCALKSKIVDRAETRSLKSNLFWKTGKRQGQTLPRKPKIKKLPPTWNPGVAIYRAKKERVGINILPFLLHQNEPWRQM